MFVSGFHLRERYTLEECRKGKCVCLRCLENKNAVEMQSIYKPGGADTRETWFSIAIFCTFRPFSLFGSDFQLFKLSCSNSKFCFYPALACLNIQATSNISKIWLIPFVQRVRNLCLLSSLLTLNLENELNKLVVRTPQQLHKMGQRGITAPASTTACKTTMSASRWTAWSLVQKFYKSVFSGTPCISIGTTIALKLLLW